MSKFRSEKSSIIKLDKATKHSRIPRNNEEACFMTLLGNMTKERAALETERRFYGDKGVL